jgi:hypothetical protein
MSKNVQDGGLGLSDASLFTSITRFLDNAEPDQHGHSQEASLLFDLTSFDPKTGKAAFSRT